MSWNVEWSTCGCPSFGRGENESKNRFGIGRGPSRSLVENDLVCACFDILGKGRFSLTVANRHRFHPLPSTVDELPAEDSDQSEHRVRTYPRFFIMKSLRRRSKPCHLLLDGANSRQLPHHHAICESNWKRLSFYGEKRPCSGKKEALA